MAGKPIYGERLAPLNIRVPEWLRERIQEDARRERRTMSDMARLILEDYYNHSDNKGQ